MAKMFCLKCNGATEYSATRPTFCSLCGKPYVDSIASVASRPAELRKQKSELLNDGYREVEMEYPEDATSVPNIDKIECVLTVANLRPNRQNGKDLFNEGSPSSAREVIGNITKKHTRVSKAQQKAQQHAQQNQVREDFANQLRPRGRNNRGSSEVE